MCTRITTFKITSNVQHILYMEKLSDSGIRSNMSTHLSCGKKSQTQKMWDDFEER